MNRMATTVEHDAVAEATPHVAGSTARAVTRGAAAALGLRLAPIALAVGPAVAVGAAAVLGTGWDEARLPALAALFGALAAVSFAHRALLDVRPTAAAPGGPAPEPRRRHD